MERQILHLRVASFPVAVYRVKDPSLRERSLVVAAGRGPRAVVVSASEQARGEGIRTGMTLTEARRQDRRVLVLPPDPFLFERAERALGEILARFSPIIEPVRGGCFFIDLTGMQKLLGPAVDTARRIQKETTERLRLGPNAGLGVNKLISGVATRVLRPVSLLDIVPGEERGFLSPLPVRHLPVVDPATEGRLLDELNIRKILQLRAVDLFHLGMAFGSKGLTLYRQSRGIDESPVRPPDRMASVEEDETLPEDTNDDATLLAILHLLVERCGARLRKLGLPSGEAVFSARYTDGVSVSRAVRIVPPSMSDLTLLTRVRPLFEHVVERRGRVRYLRVRFTRLTNRSHQLSLFDTAAGTDIDTTDDRREPALIAALDRLRGRFGRGTVIFGRTGRALSGRGSRDAA